MRLRISWGGGVEQTWQGSLRVSGGTLSECQSLSLNTDSPGAIQLINEAISIRQPSPSSYGGFDVTLDGYEDALIEVELYPSDRPDERFQESIEFSQLLSGTLNLDIDQQQNQITFARAPGDQLRIDIAQPSQVFKPGEMMSLGITPNLTGIAARSANCRLKIVPARKTAPTIWTRTFEFTLDEEGSGRRERLELPMPGTEGVYDLIIELDPNWYQVPFNNRKQSVRRTIQLVVLDKKDPINTPDEDWRNFLTIDPTNGRVLTRSTNASLVQLNRLITATNNRPLGNNKFQSIQNGEEIVGQLDVGGWHAIPLAINKRGMPHIVEIEFPSDQPMAIGTSIIQTDPAGQIPSVGFDSGLVIPDSIVRPEPTGDASVMMKHRIVFWPNTENPYLLIANRHEKLPARIGKIRILHGPRRLPDQDVAIRFDSDSREFMAFYEMPLFPENFGSDEVVDPVIQQPLDDWLTFYLGADRFVQYLKANSYVGAYITVAIDGSAIYPSQLLDPTPKFDSGVFFDNGQDPKRKDILEMLFRMFDRAGLKLVPTLAFTAPLPEIEAIRRQAGSKNEFDLINFRGQQRTNAQKGLPIYNPLNVEVQRAVTRVVEELAERYRDHDSFNGLAISCRPDTYTQLAGMQWCYDRITIGRFRTIVNSDATDEAFTNELISSRKQEWLNWRAEQMTAWYLQMLQSIQRHKSDAKLILAPSDIYQNEEISSALSPSLHLPPDFDGAMLQLGFSRSLPTTNPDLVLLKPQRIAPNQSLASQRVEIQTMSSKQAGDFFRQGNYRGNLISSRISWAHFSELQEQTEIGNQSAPLIRLQQLSPAGAWNRKRFAMTLRDNDSNVFIDGGILISNGQESHRREFMKVFCQLPNVRFTDVNPKFETESKSPIAVRQAKVGDGWFFYAVNSSPWPATCKINLAHADANNIRSLSNVRFSRQNGSANFEFEIEPFGLVGGVANDTKTSILDFAVQFPDNAEQPLRTHLQALQSKLVRASKVPPLNALANPDFEVSGQPSLEGWDFGGQSTQRIRIDNQQGHTGSSSLIVASDGPTVWIRSSAFAAPETGRLSVSVWLRTDDPENQPPLRLALEGHTANADYYRFGSIGALAPASATKRVEGHWQRFAVHFDDLPIQGIDDLRIGFDLMGPGQVWIDNVEVYDRWFDSNDTKAITQLLATAGLLLSDPENIDQCRKILNGYWPRFLDEYFPDLVAPAKDGSVKPSQTPEARTVKSSRTRPAIPRKRSSFR